ncbi:amine oxidase, flavin-containing superfamily [Aspergillus clavatus NRRL 1]|uniref:Amine oxidase domain-containing protein n=1 Tax=Aspergillus clavatus (strain ATCC 1007 / CBS 513.65 / DSM 816 / NCTC 3887 / NRRL 1 / QM 1276 / 107) TaxID=344612 RepID=A1C5M2_ASPCL|nr:uncharacterized protein ACLA_004040 [Aspergillus clavatus NRRL 1]EAW14990.1 conserved hypothetical protein [Aspergillus clavatus NRRL 1]
MVIFWLASFCLTLCLALPGLQLDTDISQFHESVIINRDVCVIGGGASGTYAAVRLRQMGHSVAVVEKEPVLGGHTNTYFDPVSGRYVDYGVLVFQDIPEVRSYFEHFNISTTIQVFDRLGPGQRVDIRTGERVPPPAGNVTAAIIRYTEQLAKYPYLSDGWDLPNPVPEDLLMPFGKFIEKYDLGPAVEILTLYIQGLGDWLQYPTVYMMKYFSLAVVNGSQNGFLVTVNRNNGALYQAATKELGSDALLSSTVLAMDRPQNRPHTILVRTPSGIKLIRAKKTIITIPPKVNILRNFNLDTEERSLFEQFRNTYYYTTVTKVSGLPAGLQIINRAADTPYNLPPLPAVYLMSPTVAPDLYSIYYGGPQNEPDDQVKRRVRDSVRILRKAGFNTSEPEILAFSNHSPFELFVSAEQIADGFYRDLDGLQGHRSTYYAGAAFHTHDSSALWRFVDGLLRRMYP